LYIPHIPESLISICAFAFVGFAYVIFSRLFPVIPVWEVLEGQVIHGVRRIGRALIPTKSEPE
jgi:molybdopterin-containing oxidoreductase family membrane subunit